MPDSSYQTERQTDKVTADIPMDKVWENIADKWSYQSFAAYHQTIALYLHFVCFELDEYKGENRH